MTYKPAVTVCAARKSPLSSAAATKYSSAAELAVDGDRRPIAGFNGRVAVRLGPRFVGPCHDWDSTRDRDSEDSWQMLHSIGSPSLGSAYRAKAPDTSGLGFVSCARQPRPRLRRVLKVTDLPLERANRIRSLFRGRRCLPNVRRRRHDHSKQVDWQPYRKCRRQRTL